MHVLLSEPLKTGNNVALDNSSSWIAAILMRDLPRKHRNALRDFYVLEDDDATVCARNGLSLIAWRELKGRVSSISGPERDTEAN
jgi:hypothetical protein